MISLYRIEHRPNQTLIRFQGNSSDAEQISRMLPFVLHKDKKQLEGGYYTYLDGDKREKYELEMSHYLKSKYRPLPLELSIFTTHNPLPRTRSRDEWRFLVANCINRFFEEKEYSLIKKGGKSTIYRRKPKCYSQLQLEAYEGISYTLRITPEWEPILTCDISYRYRIDGEFADRRALETYAVERPEILSEMRNFETRNAESKFDLMRDFISSLPVIPKTDELTFRTEPMNSGELGYETWLWEHEMKPCLEVGQGRKVPLANWISDYNFGLYAPPSADLEVIYVYPDATFREWYQQSDSYWDRLGNIIRNCLRKFLGNHVAIHKLPYTLDRTVSDFNAKIDKLPELSKNLLIVMLIPPRVNNHPVLSELEKSTSYINKQLRKLKGSYAYVSAVEWTNFRHDNQDNIIESCLLKGFMAIGAQPWRLANMPLSKSEPHSTCFIGIDAPKRSDGEAMIGGVILDTWGILRGYHIYKVPQGSGEFADPQTFKDLTVKLIQHFVSTTNNPVKHVILHRDGRTHEREWSLLPQALAEQRITMDLVEIRKRNQPLLRQSVNRGGTPSKDIAIGNIELKRAYLNNTLSIRKKGDGPIFPATQSIQIVKVKGVSPLKELAAQVHALTRVHYGAYRRTVYVPATIDYADAMVKNVHLQSTQTNGGNPLNSDVKPKWL